MNLAVDNKNTLSWTYDPQSFLESFHELANFPGFKPNYHNPILFLIGEHSEYVSKFDYPSISNLYPQAKIKEISNVGHLIHIEAPKIFISTLSKFLESHKNKIII
uniref:Protein ABHD11 (Trinotate prediction) n=1 Tax=Henneguya salminicola TaxID=69463 RepID=A0A6G3MGY6_HENSL